MMDAKLFDQCKDSVDYLEENARNYYFMKRYQRFNPSPQALDVFRNIEERTNVIVLASRNCPICIATIPVLLRLHLDVGNPNMDIRVIENGSPSLPAFLSDKRSPFVVFYDGSFNELFNLDQKQIETNFETILVEELEKLSNRVKRTNI